jgi:CubicO group peptidase (beta-lactamase class C family)
VQASRRSVPLPADIVDLAPPKCFLDEGSLAAFKDKDRNKAIDPRRLNDAIEELMLRQLEAGTQVGMQVSVYYKGLHVAHVCGGVYRSMEGWAANDWKAVDPSTLFMSYSVCKGVAAAGLMTCVDRGECAYEDKVSSQWAAFAQGGKGDVTIADAVSHRAGMPGITLSFLPVVAAHAAAAVGGWSRAWRAGLAFIENYKPEWPPGSAALYHYVSFSWIIGGIIERVSGQHIHQLVRDRVAAPLHQHGNMFVGLLPRPEHARAARLETPHAYAPLPEGWGAPDEPAEAAPTGGEARGSLSKRLLAWLESSVFVAAGNAGLWRRVCLPSSNGFFTAHALGSMYGALS